MRFIPHWRKATWGIVIWTALMAIWVIAGINNGGPSESDCGVLSRRACEAAYGVGTGIGVGLVILLWFIGFIVLGLVWFMSRPGRDTVVYSPEGAQVTTTRKEAKRLVDKQGWKYTR